MLDNTKVRDEVVIVDGVEVRYSVSGPETERAPLVLVHGTAGSADSHFGYIFPMMAHRQRVIALDFSEPSGEDLELDHLTAQVSAVIEAESPSVPVSLLGYSLGAVVAAKLAIEQKDKVANLILVAGWMKTDTHQKLRNHVWKSLRDQDVETITEYMVLCAFSPKFMSTRTLEDIRAAANTLSMSSFVDKQMDLNTRIDIAADCETITAKTLVIGCTFDMMVPKHHAKALFGAIENARYTEIPSGHAVVHERAAELFHHIDRFTLEPDTYAAGTIIPAQKP